MKKKNQKSFSTKEVVLLVILACLLTFGMAISLFRHKDNKFKYVEDENLSLFLEQYNYIVNNYYEEVDKKELIDGAIIGMLYALGDPYADYYDDISSDSFMTRLIGNYDGLGIEIVKFNNGPIYVIDVLKGSNAEKAGIKVNDIIIKIDDLDIATIDNNEFLDYVKNNDKEFEITLSRDDKKIVVKVKKSHINMESVEYKVIDGYGYLKMNLFALNSYDQFKKGFEYLNSKDIKGLIIDLRDNGGGHLTITEDILALFLDSSKVIYQVENQTNREKVYSKGNKDYKLPIAIIVNENSASASELITINLKEHLNAVVIGEKTYGKGTIQKVVDLPDGKQYKVTTDKWLSSKGYYNEGKGIEPDVIIKDATDEEYIKKAIEVLKEDN